MLTVLADIIALLTDVTGADASWADRLTAPSRLEGDLHLDSLELAAFAARLRSVYGDGVDLAAFIAGLDIDQLIGLSVGDLADYVSRTQRSRR
jgi:acyl carrier protein